MLERAVADLHAYDRAVFGVAPTAKAARVLERETQMRCDTVAKVLWEHTRADRDPSPEYQLARASRLTAVGIATFLPGVRSACAAASWRAS